MTSKWCMSSEVSAILDQIMKVPQKKVTFGLSFQEISRRSQFNSYSWRCCVHRDTFPTPELPQD